MKNRGQIPDVPKLLPSMRKRNQRNLPRIILQYSVLALLLIFAVRSYFQEDYTADFEAYCPFGGIQALSSFFLNNSLSCSMTTVQIAMGIMLVVGIFLFSKLFCAFICPLGTITEWLGRLGDKYKISKRPGPRADAVLRSLKYILLFITFYFTLASNELFCKTFDPYYAVASGFGSDVVMIYAVSALVLLIAGSLIVRLFWCKYLCPLGAVSNIFRFAWLVLAVLLAYVLLLKTGAAFSYVWPLAAICLGGYLLEISRLRSNFLPVTKIYRNEPTCTGCGLCSRKCPQLIDVAGMKVVDHPDCNLCGDCLEVCPEKDTLRLNNRSWLKWLPPVAVVVLFALGLGLSSNWELPTIDQRWGTPESLKNAAEFSQSGISSIKCYGSSMAFAAKMKEMKGVLGVSTYVGSHSVKVYYDPAVLNDSLIQAELFVPRRSVIREPVRKEGDVHVASLLLDNFFDPTDFDKLTFLLKEKTDALGAESEFSCPVTLRIYFPGDNIPEEKQLKELLETRKAKISSGESVHNLEMNYRVAGKISFSKMETRRYRQLMFDAHHRKFNWKESYREEMLDTLTVPIGELPYDKEALPYFVSHLSNDDGVVGFHSEMDSLNSIYFKVVYIGSMTNADKILEAMKSDSLTVNYEGGEKGRMLNMYRLK